MSLAREEAIKRHRELWGWLVENPIKERADWPGWEKYRRIQYDCFCCEFAGRAESFDNCKNCPLEWPALQINPNRTPCGNSYFDNWRHAAKPEDRSKYAALIRDLPEKEEKPALKVGDWVKVLRDGGCFTTYPEFFQENNLSQFSSKYKNHKCISEGQIYQIVGMGKHSSCNYGPIYVLQSQEGQVYLTHNGYGNRSYLEITEPREFKVGDRVRVKTNLIIGKGYGADGFVSNMNKYKGMIATIFKKCGKMFKLDVDGGYWNWTPEMLELLDSAASNLCPTPRTEKYIFNGPATICIIEQNGKQYKGVVKCYYKDVWDEQIGRQEARKKALEQMNR